MRREIPYQMPANKIRKIRKAIGFSQDEFARFLWVTYSTLNRWEAGRAFPFGLHLQILILLQKRLSNPSFRAVLRDPRAVDPLFLLYGLLKLRYRSSKSRPAAKTKRGVP